MKIRILAPTLVGGVWHEMGVGNYSPALGQHLIDMGVAELFETKIIEEIEVKTVKKPQSLPLSQPAKVLPKKTRKKRTKKPQL
jgi:hypothetical protein